MREFEELFTLRCREVEKHLAFIEDLHESALNRSGGRPVDTEHVNILKSGFLVHLYNVIESVMAKVIDDVAANTRAHNPHDWHDGVFIAWLRHRAATEQELDSSDRVERMVRVIAEASGRRQIGSTYIAKKESNWSHKEIRAIAETLTCRLAIREDVETQACVVHFMDQKPPMLYVRHMRNQLAHGNLSFVDAASALSTGQLEFLHGAVIEYMKDVVTSFNSYLDAKQFLRVPAA
ncbi:hypothetical protein ABID21_000636 [Pseudorhizobium tarimense]|uniref:MAE-28990/MAE-18760-like HEPN domain-containing protein n=1 Tax=Pseudorhizobium tarimense TaxID=1079109 RepID=A0ABV2H1W6_9HYPH|nr:MAE_28990/MAE_18760 family HEPN-like nuclease [Pseudorhizobium tarimense]MCJ8517849.1 MAE_28990/MAE_18760 family HEPN-like nuclease [Pseudorhizobium tarimense]